MYGDDPMNADPMDDQDGDKDNGKNTGQGAVDVSTKAVGWALNAVLAVAIVCFTLLFIVPDLALGPQFLIAYSNQGGGTNITNWNWLPWVNSAATSGVLYLLAHQIQRVGFRNLRNATPDVKIAWGLAATVTIIDTITDIGGMTAWLTGDPAQGAQVIPDERSPLWWVCLVLTIVVCGCQEFILEPLLRMGDQLTDIFGRMHGGFFLRGSMAIAGLGFALLRAVCIFGAGAGIVILDVVLSAVYLADWARPQSSAPGLTVGAWVLSLACTAAAVLFYYYLKRTGRRLRKDFKRFTPREKFMAVFVITANTVDGALDLSGMNTYLLGETGFILPAQVSIAWVMLAALTLILLEVYQWILPVIIPEKIKKMVMPDQKKGFFGKLFKRKPKDSPAGPMADHSPPQPTYSSGKSLEDLLG